MQNIFCLRRCKKETWRKSNKCVDKAAKQQQPLAIRVLCNATCAKKLKLWCKKTKKKKRKQKEKCAQTEITFICELTGGGRYLFVWFYSLLSSTRHKCCFTAFWSVARNANSSLKWRKRQRPSMASGGEWRINSWWARLWTEKTVAIIRTNEQLLEEKSICGKLQINISKTDRLVWVYTDIETGMTKLTQLVTLSIYIYSW